MFGTAKRIARADVVNLGSTYAYYDFNYEGLPFAGVNLAHRPQYLNVDLKYVVKFNKFFKNGKKVLVILPNFVFAADAKAMSARNDQFYFLFFPWELEWFTLPRFAGALVRTAAGKGTGLLKRIYHRLFHGQGGERSPAEKEAAAQVRIHGWQSHLGIPSLSDGDVPEALRINLRKNIDLLDELIRQIKSAGAEPYIVIPPTSEIMNRKITKECIQAYLLDPIEARKDKTVPVLNYMYDPAYQDASLYRDADCLNRTAAAAFTRDVCRRIGLQD